MAADADLATCTDRNRDYRESDPGTRYLTAPAVAGIERVWILDVAGDRVVLDLGISPGSGRERTQQMLGIVESVRFDM